MKSTRLFALRHLCDFVDRDGDEAWDLLFIFAKAADELNGNDPRL